MEDDFELIARTWENFVQGDLEACRDLATDYLDGIREIPDPLDLTRSDLVEVNWRCAWLLYVALESGQFDIAEFAIDSLRKIEVGLSGESARQSHDSRLMGQLALSCYRLEYDQSAKLISLLEGGESDGTNQYFIVGRSFAQLTQLSQDLIGKYSPALEFNISRLGRNPPRVKGRVRHARGAVPISLARRLDIDHARERLRQMASYSVPDENHLLLERVKSDVELLAWYGRECVRRGDLSDGIRDLEVCVSGSLVAMRKWKYSLALTLDLINVQWQLGVCKMLSGDWLGGAQEFEEVVNVCSEGALRWGGVRVLNFESIRAGIYRGLCHFAARGATDAFEQLAQVRNDAELQLKESRNSTLEALLAQSEYLIGLVNLQSRDFSSALTSLDLSKDHSSEALADNPSNILAAQVRLFATRNRFLVSLWGLVIRHKVRHASK